MSKQERRVRQTNLQTNSAQGQQFEHTEVFDDNLLPDAMEIAKLHQIDPTILDWLKCRAEKEQEFRHTTFSTRAKIIDKNEANNRALNIIGIICAFLIFGGGMAFSCFLIEKGCTVTGTIFTGFTLLAASSLFITRRVKANAENKQLKK